MVKLEVVEEIAYQAPTRTFKYALKHHLRRHLLIPLKGASNAEFVWRMEDVLEVYSRPNDPPRPRVWMEEPSKKMLRGTPGTPCPGRAQLLHFLRAGR